MIDTPNSNSPDSTSPASAPPRPAFSPMYGQRPPQPPGRRFGWVPWVLLVLAVVMLAGSLMMNLVLGVGIAAVSGQQTGSVQEEIYRSGDEAHRIVILPLQGVVDDEMVHFVRQALEHLRGRTISTSFQTAAGTRPAALVLRVDSPGGGVNASDRIWHMLKQYQKETGIPVIASYGGMATSGGYYVSCLADTIFAEPTTLTGSVGVIMQGMTFERLLDKVGVTPQTHHSTPAVRKDALNPFRSWTTDDTAMLKNILDTAHDRFVDVIAQSRSVLPEPEIKRLKIDTGEPFTAEQAKQLQVIDQIGYLDDAIDHAQSQVRGSSHSQVVILKQKPTFMELLESRSSAKPITAQSAAEWRSQLIDLTSPKLEYRWTLAPP